MNINPIDVTGERRLWSAALWLAIRDLDRANGRGLAANWIFSGKGDVGSMRWICDMLDFDYNKLQTMCMTRSGRAKLLGKKRDEHGTAY